ncbi:MAG TPA: 4Fe-4S dicluster domain-containing protein [bacterium]|nr:4Fe-4S dicluster domain-containing protein [bacterium]
MYKITVDHDKCTGCESCVDICPFDVFEMQNEKSVPVRPEDCEGCMSCVESCAEEAIVVEEM